MAPHWPQASRCLMDRGPRAIVGVAVRGRQAAANYALVRGLTTCMEGGAPPRLPPDSAAESGVSSRRVPCPVAALTPSSVCLLCKRMFGIPGNHSCAFSPLFFV